MEGNPFAALVGMMDGSGEAKSSLIMRRGAIRTVTPLTVDVGGITVSGDELRINAAMLKHWESVAPAGEIPPGFEAEVAPRLSAGDTVLLLTEDDQLFYLLCKVVSV